ncbi:hypothetical protein AAG906_003951 [Vitis piasezkii]
MPPHIKMQNLTHGLLLGGGRAIITLRAADIDRGRCCDCQRSWEAIVGSDLPSLHSCPFTLQVAERFLLPPCAFCGLAVFFWAESRVWDGYAATSSGLPGDAHAEKSVDKLNVGSFERFFIPNVQCWAPVPPPVAVQGIPSLHSDSSSLHPPQYGPGADGIQHSKHAVQPRPLAVGGAKGHVLVRGAWAGLLEHPERPFSPNHSLVPPGKSACGVCPAFVLLFFLLGLSDGLISLVADNAGPDKRGRVVEWVEKASFARLNKLFEIRHERHYETPPSCRTCWPLSGSPKRTRCKRPTLRNAKHSLTIGRGGGKRELCGRLLVKNAPHPLFLLEPQRKRRTRRRSNNKRARGLLLALCFKRLQTPRGSESFGAFIGPASRRSHSARDLKSGLIGWLQDRFLETIEVNCSSVQDDHPEGSEMEMVVETPTAPVLVPDGGSPGATQPAENEGPHPVDDAACISASSFSYAELEEKLRRILPDSAVAMPSAKMFEAVEMRRNSEEELRLRLEQAKASLSSAREDNKALRVELAEAKSREESADARLYEAEDEVTHLRGEVRQLRTDVSIEKKLREDLQLRLSPQKEELEGEFAAEREELEADYQK